MRWHKANYREMPMSQKPELKELPIEQLQRGKYQPRRQFDPEALQELAISIQANGLIQPIVVRPISSQQYEIIAGERRWRACQIAGFRVIRCLVNRYTDEQAAAVTTIENINRVDLNPIEEAHAYQRLIQDFRYLHEEVAAIVGKSRVTITNSLRLLELDPQAQQFLIDGKLMESHGKLLAGIPQHLQYEIANKTVSEGWSTRKLEQEIKTLLGRTLKTAAKTKDPNIAALERVVSDHLGSEVRVDAEEEGQPKGWLKIRYFDLETLEGLLQKMGIRYE